MKKQQRIIQRMGWYGVVAIVTAYALASFGVLHPRDLEYQLLNASGALAMVLEASHRKDWPPVVLNLIWITIAIISIVRGFI